ncbi:NADH-quinone oxidoreductase subunit C [bacterium]|nr:NADH-quinone oxidoreductase subunit C [bacterium]MBU1989436.1 NADH-quinone oxidoreductase subunit C [bacterium]
MKKIEVALKSVRDEIKSFYDYKKWHFLTLNGVALEDNRMQVQWIFSKYEALDEVVIYYAEIDYTERIPSLSDIIPSAIISQRELVDMFGVEVEGSEKGLYLDEDSMQTPLRSCLV